jgi:diketogulonate reductase-like aldo/keto reductase
VKIKIRNLCKSFGKKQVLCGVDLDLYFGSLTDDYVKMCKENGINVEAWYPIAHGDKNLINNSIFTEMAKKYKKTNAQIILRWHIQKGFIIFPRAKNPVHLEENINIFDFKLSEEEMKKIDGLDKNKIYVNW